MNTALFGILMLSLSPSDGAELLQPATMPGMCLTIDEDEGSVSVPCNPSRAQHLTLPHGEAGPIRLGERCLAPRGTGLYPPVFAEACDGSQAQKWTLSPEGEVRNAAGRCLSVLGLSSRDGERIYAGGCPKERAGQYWRVVDADAQSYSPVRGWLKWQGDEELCLGWIEAGSFVGLTRCNPNAGSEQRLSFDRDYPTQIRSRSGCLTSNAMTGGIVVTRCTAGPRATWTLNSEGQLTDGAGYCAEAWKDGDHWAVGMAKCNDTAAQRWNLAPLP